MTHKSTPKNKSPKSTLADNQQLKPKTKGTKSLKRVPKAKKQATNKANTKNKGKATSKNKSKAKSAFKNINNAGIKANDKLAPFKNQGERALVVVESPAKAKTIKKYLGAGYMVKASVGHIKDLQKSKLSVDLENGFAPHYETIRGKSKVIKEIKEAVKTVDYVYLAPDPDREGEAIAWHIAEEIGKKGEGKVFRIAFNEITKKAIQAAIANPQPLNKNLYDSQQARRILDRIVGYQISPILWDKVRRGLSAGRVQSVAVRLVVEREREIAAFKSEEYWSLECQLAASGPPSFVAKVIKENGQKFEPKSQSDIKTAETVLNSAKYNVANISRKERRRRAGPPLITSKLQQEAANRLRFTAKRTMMIAQQLYEGVELGKEGAVALITYMRTDSTRVSQDAQNAAREYINNTFGASYVPETPNIYKTKQGAQDAHEAIRPTSLDYPPERVSRYLTSEQAKLYGLIWRWFVASQMAPAVYDQTTVDINAANYGLRATGSIMKFPGFLVAHGVTEVIEEDKGDKDKDDAGTETKGMLPELSDGEQLALEKLLPEQHFTQPPPRFSESTLVRELEERGIGRPSTYATIMSTIISRGYVEKHKDARFYPSELGALVTDLLTVSFPRVLDVKFTAQMEDMLDEVEEGKVDWQRLLSDFYFGGFQECLERAKTEMRDVKREEIPTEHTCSECGEPMVIKWGRNGSFLACRGYPKCRNTRDYMRRSDQSIEILPEPTTDETCPQCGGPMVVKRGRFGQFLACENYPTCKGTKPMSIGVACPNGCGGYIAERRSKRGRTFYGCSSYPSCNFASWDRPINGPCPVCGHAYLINKVRKDGVIIRCANRNCAYTRDPELDDDDARAAAAVG
ncbi:MAG: type I DNA topoisomerase [Deltaproteobacteria bacterium]|nr:type I DNA topoisomerase [Deltaproteobacteria bacterium]